jgi:BirA family biotin operon repressor/biotin-[acetyl-CoA-carboxylase] ligase
MRRTLITAYSSLELHRVAQCDTTMEAIKKLLDTPKKADVKASDPDQPATASSTGAVPTPCVGLLANQQTAGQGTGGRSWVSPAGNLYYTLAIPRDSIPMSHLPILPLLVGLSMRETMVEAVKLVGTPAPAGNKIAADLKLKWPNDVIWQGKKMAGTLITEHTSSSDATQSHLLIGIGMNILEAPTIADGGRPTGSLAMALTQATGEADSVALVKRLSEDDGKLLLEMAATVTTKIMTRLETAKTHPGFKDPKPSFIGEFDRLMDREIVLYKRLAGPTGGRGAKVLPIRLLEWGQLEVRHEDGTTEVLLSEYLY